MHLSCKSDARSYEVLHLSRKIISANLKIWCSKMQPLSGNQRLDLRTSLMNMSLVLRLPRKMDLCRSSSNVPHLPSFFWTCYKTLTFCSLLRRCTVPCAYRAKAHLNLQKWCEHVVFLTFWLGNVLRATTEMCFAPQLRALFRHLNLQMWSEPGVFCTFWLRNVLRATTACTFSTTSKSVPNVRCFYLFHWQMRFGPQRRALFRHLNF